MKNIILAIVTIFPMFLFSQDISIKKRNEIQKVVRECLRDYEAYVRVSSSTTEDFYDLFTKNESIINDVYPSETFSTEINKFDWKDIMKNSKLYDVITEVKEWEKFEPMPMTSDSGYVDVIVRKDTRSRWSENSKKQFNIVVEKNGKEIVDRVRYSSSEDLRFRFWYNLNAEFVKCRIKSISKIYDLKRKNVYVVYQKPPYLIAKKQLITKEVLNDFKTTNNINFIQTGDEISYILADENINKENYQINGLRKPKIKSFENLERKNPILKQIIYEQRLPIRVSYSLSVNTSDMFDFGTSLVPDNVSYSENMNFSISTDLLKIAKNLFLGVSYNMVNSNTNINSSLIQSISELPNPITQNQSTYFRKNSVINFSEDLTFNQSFIMPTAYIRLQNGLTFFGALSIYSNSTVTSNRNGQATYTGIFEDNFNIEISEPIEYTINGNINTLDLGTEVLNVQENINVQNTVSLIDIGVSYNLDFLVKNLIIHSKYRNNRENLFTKSKNELSPNRDEFNSITEVVDLFKPNDQLYFGITYEVKF